MKALPITCQQKKTFRQLLDEVFRASLEANSIKGLGTMILLPNGQLDDMSARTLHEALCRQEGKTFEQIIAKWNAASPPDDQW